MDKNHILHAVWVFFFFHFCGWNFQLPNSHTTNNGPMDRFFFSFISLAFKSLFHRIEIFIIVHTAFFWQRDAWNAGRWCVQAHWPPSCPYVSLYGNYALAVIIFVYNIRALGHLARPERLLFCYVSQFTHKIISWNKKNVLNLSSFNALSGVNIVTHTHVCEAKWLCQIYEYVRLWCVSLFTSGVCERPNSNCYELAISVEI